MTSVARSRIAWCTPVLGAVVMTSLVLLLVGPASSQPRRDRLDDLAFLDGCWAHLTPDWVMTMCWAREGDAWVGTSDAEPFGEWDVDLRIAREDGGLVLRVRPRTGAFFGLRRATAVSIEPGRAVFRNRGQRVVLEREGDRIWFRPHGGGSGYPLERDRVETATSR
jgi:hypothetical protein